ncbi:MAG: cysteinyl-tRNA synthetase [Anaerolineae bacterium]|nr:MAG: cysteinyl-tRNA synthetase [Anaerolineae bacterium]
MREQPRPGLIALFGSGETSPSGRRIFERVLQRCPEGLQLALLETPSGFEPNSAQVVGRIADFITERLQNYRPRCHVIPARKRGTPFSPDDQDLLAPMLQADVLFMGPGSPTYAVRQLRGSLAWAYLRALHRLGVHLTLASAASIAISAYALPVYEIYKVGEDLHWKPGLNLLADYGFNLIFVPHWNNSDGGEELDTSCCYLGVARFERLLDLLPDECVVVGIDEHTGLLMDLQAGRCEVVGAGGVTVGRAGKWRTFREEFPLQELGTLLWPSPGEGVDATVWQRVERARKEKRRQSPRPPAEVLALVARREQARQRKDWARADALRAQIRALGWMVQDTPDGPRLVTVEQ